MISYPMCAVVSLFAISLLQPLQYEAACNVMHMRAMVNFLQKMKTQEGFDVARLRHACVRLEQILHEARSQAGSPSADPSFPASDSGEHEKEQTGDELVCALSQAVQIKTDREQMRSLLRLSNSPMYLAQSLISNIETRDTENGGGWLRILDLPWEGGQFSGPCGPELLNPQTFGFAFEPFQM